MDGQDGGWNCQGEFVDLVPDLAREAREEAALGLRRDDGSLIATFLLPFHGFCVECGCIAAQEPWVGSKCVDGRGSRLEGRCVAA